MAGARDLLAQGVLGASQNSVAPEVIERADIEKVAHSLESPLKFYSESESLKSLKVSRHSAAAPGQGEAG
jgi:hypothetical protein